MEYEPRREIILNFLWQMALSFIWFYTNYCLEFNLFFQLEIGIYINICQRGCCKYFSFEILQQDSNKYLCWPQAIFILKEHSCKNILKKNGLVIAYSPNVPQHRYTHIKIWKCCHLQVDIIISWIIQPELGIYIFRVNKVFGIPVYGSCSW